MSPLKIPRRYKGGMEVYLYKESGEYLTILNISRTGPVALM